MRLLKQRTFVSSNFRWLLALLVVFSLVFCQKLSVGRAAVFEPYDQSVELMKALGVWPDGAQDISPLSAVNRASLAKILVRALGITETAGAAEQIFEDVPVGHPAAGAIAILNSLKIMEGNGNGLFMPDGEVTIDQIVKVTVAMLGYPFQKDSYYALAFAEGIFRGVDFDPGKAINYAQLAKILENTLSTPIIIQNYGNTGEYVKSGSHGEPIKTILGQYLGVEKYNAKVLSVNDYSKTMILEITNKAKTEGLPSYSMGSRIQVRTEALPNPTNLLGMDVEIWIDKGENAVYCRIAKEQDVFYSYITAVNGDDGQNKYFGNYIRRVEIDGTVYEVADDFQCLYNGKDGMGSSHIYAKRPAKIILNANKISRMEVFDAIEGGLIIGITPDRLSYTQGMGNKKYIDELGNFNNIYTIIDNEMSSYDSLTNGMLMDFCTIDDDTLYIFASTYKISDKLVGVNDQEVFIGDVGYPISAVFGAYYSNKDGLFTGLSDQQNVINQVVTVWLDGAGEVRYVARDARFASNQNQEFYGFLIGMGIKGIDGYQISIYKAAEGKVEKETYNLISNVKMPCSMDEFKSTASKIDSSCLWLFRTNSEGEISEILRPESVKSVSKSVIEYVHVDTNRKAIAFTNQPGTAGRLLGHVPAGNATIAGLVQFDGEFKVIGASINEFGVEMFAQNVNCALYKSPMQKDAELIVFWRETYPYSYFTSYECTLAILKRITKTVDSDGQELYKMEMITEAGSETHYVGEDIAKFLKKNCLFGYRLRVMFSPYNFVLSPPSDGSSVVGVTPFVADLDNPQLYETAEDVVAAIDKDSALDTRKVILYKGTIHKMEDNTVWFADSDKYVFQIASNCNILKFGANNDIVRCDKNTIQNGVTVYFYLNNKGDIDIMLNR